VVCSTHTLGLPAQADHSHFSPLRVFVWVFACLFVCMCCRLQLFVLMVVISSSKACRILRKRQARLPRRNKIGFQYSK
jgi:hypothetical protein